jgi:hypothetical protein
LTLCLATGEAVEIFRTEEGDTLVGPSRVSIDDLRPALAFAGTYAEGTAWLDVGESISFDERSFDPEGATLGLRCEAIRRVGEYLTLRDAGRRRTVGASLRARATRRVAGLSSRILKQVPVTFHPRTL